MKKPTIEKTNNPDVRGGRSATLSGHLRSGPVQFHVWTPPRLKPDEPRVFHFTHFLRGQSTLIRTIAVPDFSGSTQFREIAIAVSGWLAGDRTQPLFAGGHIFSVALEPYKDDILAYLFLFDGPSEKPSLETFTLWKSLSTLEQVQIFASNLREMATTAIGEDDRSFVEEDYSGEDESEFSHIEVASKADFEDYLSRQEYVVMLLSLLDQDISEDLRLAVYKSLTKLEIEEVRALARVLVKWLAYNYPGAQTAPKD